MAEQKQANLPHADKPEAVSQTWGNLRFYALCGATAPALFGLMVLTEGFIVPNYGHLSQYISDLGAYALYGSYAYLQNLNFWAFGVLVVLFALGSRHTLPWSRAATASLVLFGSLVFLAGVFPDQPNPWPGAAHGLVSSIAFLSIILCQFLVWRRLRHLETSEEKRWGRYGSYSLLSGLLSIVALVALDYVSIYTPAFAGLQQRVFIAIPWIWIEATALKLYRTPNTKP